MVWSLQGHRAYLGKVCLILLYSIDKKLTYRNRSSNSEEFKDKIHFIKFDVDDLPEVTEKLGVRAMPTFFIFKDGEKADEFVGAVPTALTKLLQKHAE